MSRPVNIAKAINRAFADAKIKDVVQTVGVQKTIESLIFILKEKRINDDSLTDLDMVGLGEIVDHLTECLKICEEVSR